VFVTHDIDEAIKLGDQICILNVGGVLEQLGPPEAVLSDPANAFVDDFIGGERGLKRLGLVEIGSTRLERGPMVASTADAEEARAAMRRYETDWVGVLDGERLIGWISELDLEGHATVAGIDVRPIERSVAPTDSLRAALDLVVRSHERVAIVIDEGRYLGTLGLDSIAREIAE
jgi:osmoprotectant transport system ATP-binding protein